MIRSEYPKTFRTDAELTEFAAAHGLSIQYAPGGRKALSGGEQTVLYEWTAQGDIHYRYSRDDSRQQRTP